MNLHTWYELILIFFVLSIRESCRGIFVQIVLTVDRTSTYKCYNVLVSILAVFTFFRKYNYSKYTDRNCNNTANLKSLLERQGYYMCIQLDSEIPLSFQSLHGLVHFRCKLVSFVRKGVSYVQGRFCSPLERLFVRIDFLCELFALFYILKWLPFIGLVKDEINRFY